MTSEADLIRRARRGDSQATEDLVRAHFPAAWRAAYAICGRNEAADDAVQDGFEKALRSLDRFEEGRPFAPWLHKIVVNCAIGAIRHEKRYRMLPDDTAAHRDPIAEASEARELMEGLSHLEPDRRAIVVLRLYLGYTPSEVAEILDIAEGTVHSRLSRALADLRGILEAADE